MKILVIHTRYKLKGGEDSVVANEIELLRSEGHDVSVLQFSNEGSTLLKILQLPYNYSSYMETEENIIAFKPDVIHIHNLHFGASPSILYAIKKHKIPIVVTLHNYRILCPSATLFFKNEIYGSSIDQIFPINAVYDGVYQHSRLLTFWLGFSMAIHHLLGTWKLVDRFIVLGPHSKRLFRQSKFHSLENKIIVKPNFCYPAKNVLPNVGKYYLYVGRLSEEKGVNTLLKAFSLNKLPLKIAGAGPLEADVASFSKQYPNIEFLGIQNKAQVENLMSDASALLFPSMWYETFGMVVIEAFSAGKPVIASRLGQMKNMINDHVDGLHFEAGNPFDLNRKIAFFESMSAEEKMKYGDNAKKTYEDKYTPKKNLDQLMLLYNSLVYKDLPGTISM